MPGKTRHVTRISLSFSVSSQDHGDPSSPQDDVIMGSVPSSDELDAWNDLKTLASGLHAKDPSSLAPHESILLQILRQRQYDLEKEEKKTQNRPKRCNSLVDEIMMSPPPSYQPPSSQPPPTLNDPLFSESPCTGRDQDAETAEAIGDFSAFTDVRHHPYRRSYTGWRERTASMRNRSPREARSEPQGEFMGRADEMRASTNINDNGIFEQARQCIDSSFERGLRKMREDERVAHERLRAGNELERTIHACRRELRRLMVERRQYPTDLEELANRVKQIVAQIRDTIKRRQDITSHLDLMQKKGQSFPGVWRTLSSQFCLQADLPFGMDTSTSAFFSLLSQSFSTFDSATSSADDGPDPQPSSTPVSTPGQQSSSPSSPPSGSRPRESQPFSCTYLPIMKPPFNAERRLEHYEECWSLLHSAEAELRDEHASFEQLPLPVLFDLRKDQLERLNDESIQEFAFYPHRMKYLFIQLELQGSIPDSTRIKQVSIQRELMRWHPDKIRRILPKFTPQDRKAIEAASLKITQCLNKLKQL